MTEPRKTEAKTGVMPPQKRYARGTSEVFLKRESK